MSLHELTRDLQRELKSKKALKLLNKIQEYDDINLCDNDNRTILHHIVIEANLTNFKSYYELTEFTKIIKNLTKLMSESSINMVDCFGDTVLNLASKCYFPEISWALIWDYLPLYITPSFENPYNLVNFYGSSQFTDTSQKLTNSGNLARGDQYFNSSKSLNASNNTNPNQPSNTHPALGSDLSSKISAGENSAFSNQSKNNTCSSHSTYDSSSKVLLGDEDILDGVEGYF